MQAHETVSDSACPNKSVYPLQLVNQQPVKITNHIALCRAFLKYALMTMHGLLSTVFALQRPVSNRRVSPTCNMHLTNSNLQHAPHKLDVCLQLATCTSQTQFSGVSEFVTSYGSPWESCISTPRSSAGALSVSSRVSNSEGPSSADPIVPAPRSMHAMQTVSKFLPLQFQCVTTRLGSVRKLSVTDCFCASNLAN